MSFQGVDPYGTKGGTEVIVLVQTPADVRLARGRSYIVFMRINSPMIQRLRENVEDVVRVLGLAGDILFSTIELLDNGILIEDRAADIDFQGGFLVINIAPGINAFQITNLSIIPSMYANGAIDGRILAPNSINSAAVVDMSLQKSDFAAGVIPINPAILRNATIETVTNTIDPVPLSSMPIIIPPNTLNVGDVFRYDIFGTASNSTTAIRTIRFGIEFKTATVTQTRFIPIDIPANTANLEWRFTHTIQILALGNPGTLNSVGTVLLDRDSVPFGSADFTLNTTEQITNNTLLHPTHVNQITTKRLALVERI